MRYLLLAACALGLTGCDRSLPPIADQSVRPAKVFQVTAQQTAITHEFIGRLDAMQTVDVSFEVDGALAQLPVREGQAVAQGSLIAALDPTNFQLAVQEAEVLLRLATQDLTRKQTLLRDRGISESVVDDARAQYELSQVRLSQAQKRLADSRITAPFDAFVARRYVDSGTKMQVGDRVARLSDLSALKVMASISEEIVATVTEERVIALSARFDFLPGREFPLVYRERSGEASSVAQTYEVTFTMAPPADVNLLPGMTAQVRIELKAGAQDAGVVIPTTALLSGPDGQFFVWVFDPQTGRVSRRDVTVSAPQRGGVGIASGLADGELVVAPGASQLQPGMQVRMMGEPVTRL